MRILTGSPNSNTWDNPNYPTTKVQRFSGNVTRTLPVSSELYRARLDFKTHIESCQLQFSSLSSVRVLPTTSLPPPQIKTSKYIFLVVTVPLSKSPWIQKALLHPKLQNVLLYTLPVMSGRLLYLSSYFIVSSRNTSGLQKVVLKTNNTRVF
jgi:hypothetical protein